MTDMIEAKNKKNQKIIKLALKNLEAKQNDLILLESISNNESALLSIIREGHLDLIKQIFNTEEELDNYKHIAFGFACEAGKQDIAEYLLSMGANANVWNDSALVEAARYDHLGIVKLLLLNGVDVNSKFGEPFIAACKYASLDMVKYLISQNANIHADNDMAIVRAAQHGKLETVKFLVEAGLDMNAHKGEAMWHAEKGKHTAIVEYFADQRRLKKD